MLGAILGDIVGSPYEFDENNIKTTDFPLFSDRSHFTDDTVMTIAVAEGLLTGYGDSARTEHEIIAAMRKYGKLYPNAGYGVRFAYWLSDSDPQPYYSYGNGSAMRVSAAAWLFDSLSEVEDYAELTARVTHNHPEGIKGAKATAAAIFLARTGKTKDEIRQYMKARYGYNLSRTLDEIRPDYHHVESCQETVPEAITAFLESESFEDALRKAVSLGGDSDTLAAITGSIAEGFYGIPIQLKEKALSILDQRLNVFAMCWHAFVQKKRAENKKATAAAPSKYDALFPFLPYFEARPTFSVSGGTHQLQVPVYSDTVNEFIKTCDERGILTPDYLETLNRYGVHADTGSFQKAIPDADRRLVRAILTYIIRQERYCDGLIASAIESGTMAALLRRLREIEKA